MYSSKHSLHTWNAEEAGSASELIGLGVSARTFTAKQDGETLKRSPSLPQFMCFSANYLLSIFLHFYCCIKIFEEFNVALVKDFSKCISVWKMFRHFREHKCFYAHIFGFIFNFIIMCLPVIVSVQEWPNQLRGFTANHIYILIQFSISNQCLADKA